MRLSFAYLPLQRLLGTLQRSLGAHDDPSFVALRQGHFSAKPVNCSILGLLPTLVAFLQERSGLRQRFRNPAHPFHPGLVQLPDVGLTVDSIMGSAHHSVLFVR